MCKIIGKLAQLQFPLTLKRRERFYQKLQNKLKNKKPTIIASDCFGGVLYHNLSLQFCSPTINLAIERDDFYDFLLELNGFLSVEPIEVIGDKGYPMGELEYNQKKVRLHFMHYKSFEEAKNKWEERKCRVDFSNLYIFQIYAGEVDKAYVEKFNNLPYKHKFLIVGDKKIKGKNIIFNKVLANKNYKHGMILNFKSDFSCKRYMDDCNYVRILNDQE